MTEQAKRKNLEIIKKAEAVIGHYPERKFTLDDVGTISAALGIARITVSNSGTKTVFSGSLKEWPMCHSCFSNMRKDGDLACKTCVSSELGVNNAPCNSCTEKNPRWEQRNMYCPECGRPYTEEAFLLLHECLMKMGYTAQSMMEDHESMLGNTPFQVFKNADEFCIANFLAKTFCLGFGEEQIREWLHTPLVD